jgi:tRNA-Thr(GGU) m(6)t(6)A37 methyltransferase TsaA
VFLKKTAVLKGNNNMEIKAIGYIKTDFPEKFGIPRQSGLLSEAEGKIYFYPEFRNPDAFKGLEGFSHIWLLWNFDIPGGGKWAASVKPPKLGGNTAMGVFATRSPFRPNPIGLSSVRIKDIVFTDGGPVITVLGADLKDNTLIYDIKPYLKYTDSHEDALGGFTGNSSAKELEVVFPEEILNVFPAEKRQTALKLLSLDPRPGYHDDSARIYGVSFCGYDIHFTVSDGLLTVIDAKKLGGA